MGRHVLGLGEIGEGLGLKDRVDFRIYCLGNMVIMFTRFKV